MVDSKKTNLNKKQLNFIKFKRNQSPMQIYSLLNGYKEFFKLSESIQFDLIDHLLEKFENQPRNVKALIKQQGIYSRLIECQQKKNGSKQVTQPTT